MAAVRLFSEVAPGRVAINTRDRARVLRARSGKTYARVYTTNEWKAAMLELTADFCEAWPGEPLTGPVRVEVMTRWPRLNRTGPASGLALGDVDATTKAVLDALAKAGVIEDDGQVVECVLRKEYGAPGLVVDVEGVAT